MTQIETSYEFFKRIGMREIPLNQLPPNYGWITGCGDNKGGYWNFFMPTDKMVRNDDSDYRKHGYMCRIK